MKRKFWVIFFLTMFMLTGCTSNEKRQKELRSAFDSIAIGDGKNAIVTRMGAPMKSGYKNVLGLTQETLIWTIGTQQYRIELINNNAVYKSVENTEGGTSNGTK